MAKKILLSLGLLSMLFSANNSCAKSANYLSDKQLEIPNFKFRTQADIISVSPCPDGHTATATIRVTLFCTTNEGTEFIAAQGTYTVGDCGGLISITPTAAPQAVKMQTIEEYLKENPDKKTEIDNLLLESYKKANSDKELIELFKKKNKN